MTTLPYDISRCPARHVCPDKADCLRHTAPGRTDGFQSILDFSALLDGERKCREIIRASEVQSD
jgi:hypothetical protein